MCFSAGASLSVAGALSIISFLIIKQAHGKQLYLFSLIPLFFALQQLSEGILWLALRNKISAVFIIPASYIFIFFAFIVWPLYIPMLALMYEKQIIRRRLLYIPFFVGLILAAYAAFYLVYYETETQIVSCHLLYHVKDITFSNYFIIPYLIATILPFFISSIKKMWILGLASLVSFIVSFVVYTTFLTSIWCFFAAILSMLIYWIVSTERSSSIRIGQQTIS